ncbi:MAG TPA: TetR/AcrR family transcriptional regulator [Sphingobium sp.]|nr:TetR/AcrR family transcriptional regulator [Sphingobium sp.]
MQKNAASAKARDMRAQLSGLGRVTQARKEESLSRLREAAARIFGERGYFAPSVDDIIREAGVSRPTFYRHFDGKFGAALDLFERESAALTPLWRSLGDRDYRDPSAVHQWVCDLVEYQASRARLPRMIVEMGMVEPAFLDRLGAIVPAIIDELAQSIPAFAATRGESEAARRHRAEAWLILHEIIDHSVSMAQGFPQPERALLVQLMSERVHRFVTTT